MLISSDSQTLESGDAIELPLQVVVNQHAVSSQLLPVGLAGAFEQKITVLNIIAYGRGEKPL